MHQPETYGETNSTPREGAALALKKYGHLIQWRKDNQDTVMDIGCGPANVLVDLILPVIEGKFSTIYAVDLSPKMIQFCLEKYSQMEKIKFMVLDILKDDRDFVNKYGQVDHVLSTYALHWMVDQPKGFQNIFNLIKPGGDLFSIHIISSRYFNVLNYMDQNEKWSPYFDNLKQYVPFTQNSDDPERDIKDMLSNIGFVDIFTEVVHQVATKDVEGMLALLKGISAQMDRIPEERQMEYIRDCFEYGVANDFVEVTESGEVNIALDVVILYAKKPEMKK